MGGAGASEATGAEREYRCACGGFLLSSAATWGAVNGVYCRSCGKRQAVYLGGRRAPEDTATVAGNGDPRNPPSEPGPVRPWRRGW